MAALIDAHQHFWKIDRGDYFWMPDEPGHVLRRDYGPADITAYLDKYAIEGTVLVQAAPTEDETHFMLNIANSDSRVKAVVGWTDFEAPNAADRIAALGALPKLSGFRPMVQDLPDDHWILRDDLAPAFQAIVDHDLTFDALTFPRHLPQLMKFIDRWPEMRIVVDHCSKPQIRDEQFQPWADFMRAVAEAPHIVCKLSGIATEANADWTLDDIRPYAEHVIEVFGPERVMWGSDWPVVNVAGGYERWRDAADALTSGLQREDRSAIFGASATKFYRLSVCANDPD